MRYNRMARGISDMCGRPVFPVTNISRLFPSIMMRSFRRRVTMTKSVDCSHHDPQKRDGVPLHSNLMDSTRCANTSLWITVIVAVAIVVSLPGPLHAQSAPEVVPAPSSQPGTQGRRTDPCGLLEGPVSVVSPNAPSLSIPPPAEVDHPLPINLATALRLSDARPLVIAFAQSNVAEAVAQLQRAEILWLPDFNLAFDYYRHDGADQKTEGTIIFESKNAMEGGGGLKLRLGTDDAIFLPLLGQTGSGCSPVPVAGGQKRCSPFRRDRLLRRATIAG